MELLELIQTLNAAHGPSGDEGGIRERLAELARPLADEISTDTMGNLIVRKLGSGPRVMLCAHMDSIGFIVTHVEENGFLRVGRLGGISPKEAALLLARAFSVPYEDKGPPGRSRPLPRQESPEQQFRRMERYCLRVLCDYRNRLGRWKRDYAPKGPEEEWNPLFVEALQKQDYVEYLLDTLLSPDMEERAALIASYGEEVRTIERRMADLAARDTAGRRTDYARSSPAPER